MSKRSKSKFVSARNRQLRRPVLENLESREVFAAGDLDVTFDADGFRTQNGLGSDSGMEMKVISSGVGTGIYVGNKSGLISKFNLNGQLDTTYGVNGTTTASENDDSINFANKGWAIDSNGGAIIIDRFQELSENRFISSIRVRRLDPIGTQSDPVFNSVGSNILNFANEQTNSPDTSDDLPVDVEVDSSGKIWVLAVTDTFTFSPAPGDDGFHVGHSAAVGRLNSDGTADVSFGGDGKMAIEISNDEDVIFEVRDLITLPDGGALVLGVENNDDTGVDTGIAYKVKANGTLDANFGTGGRASLGAIYDSSTFEGAVASTGEIYVSAYRVNSGAGRFELSLIKLTANGQLDSSFDGDGSIDNIYQSNNLNVSPGEMGLAVQADGKVILGYDNHAWKIARYLSNGQLDTSWGGTGIVDNTNTFLAASATNNDPNPQSVAITSSGQIIVAGRAGTESQAASFKSLIAKYLAAAPAAPSVSSQVNPFTFVGPNTDIYTNNVTVTWTGTVTGGATLTGFDVYYKVGANPKVKWQDNVPATKTSAVFNLGSAARRQTVTFFSQARDSGGGLEAEPGTPDASMNYVGAPWQNPVNKYDVDGVGTGTELVDILAMIGEYNRREVSLRSNQQIILPPVQDYTSGPYVDLTGDNIFDINDILAGIFAFNNGGVGPLGSGESPPVASGESPAAESSGILGADSTSIVAYTLKETIVDAPLSASSAPPPTVSDSALLALFMCTDGDDES